MTRFRIAVCDDEPSELEDIVQSVKRYDAHGDFDIENYTDGAVLLSDLLLKKKSFDLLLLDIEMPSNGFQMAQTLTQMEKHPLVIFVTKRHEYAVQGYGIAFRYLVKPLDESLFTAAMDQRYIGTYVIGKRKVKEIGSRHTQLKDESEWFKIPNHHPAIISVDLFEKANASIKRFSLSNKKPRDYLLRGKVFCGCCDHAMSLRNGAWFYCRHSEVAETLPCHGVRIKMADLEQVVFETIRAQMCPALGIDSNKDKLDLQTVQQAEHEEKLRSIQDSKRHLYEQYALGEIDLETYRTRKAVYDTELVQAKNVHAVITAQTKQIKSDYEIKLKQQEIVQKVGNANMLTKALIDRLINKVYVFPGDRIEIEYATQDFLETKESEKEV